MKDVASRTYESLHGRFNWAPSGGLNLGFTVGFTSLHLKHKTDKYKLTRPYRQDDLCDRFIYKAGPGPEHACHVIQHVWSSPRLSI